MLTLQGYKDLINDSNPDIAVIKRRWEDVYYGMSLHIDGACPSFQSLSGGGYIYPPNYFGVKYQYIFEQLLLSKHPRENKDTFNWRLSQYRAWTKDPFSRVVSFIKGSIMQDSNYYLKIADDELDNYIWGDNVNNEPFVTAVIKHAKNIFCDPNGILLVMPDMGSVTKDGLQKTKIVFVYSKDILLHTQDELVYKSGDDEAWVINRAAGYIRFTKDKKGQFSNAESVLSMAFDKLPCVVAGGIWNERGYYDSWLDGAKAVADEIVSTKSAEQLVNKEASHPFIIAASEECPDCAAGTVQVCGACGHNSGDCSCEDTDYTKFKLVACRSCGGSGQMSRNPADWMIAPKEYMDKKLLQIINPDVAINRFHKDLNDGLYEKLVAALHLSWIEQSQSGIAKERDAETRYQFVVSISNDIFCRIIPTLIKGVIEVVGGDTETSVIISKPTQFSIKTASDLLLEYQLASQSGMPNYIRANHLREYTDKQFGGDYCIIKKVDVILQLDSLAVATEEEIRIAVEGSGSTVKDWRYHIELPTIIDEIIRDYGRVWFLSADANIEKIKVLVNEKFVNLQHEKASDYTEGTRTEGGSEGRGYTRGSQAANESGSGNTAEIANTI